MIIIILSRDLTGFLTEISSIKSCIRDIFSNMLFQRPIENMSFKKKYIYLFININSQIAWKKTLKSRNRDSLIFLLKIAIYKDW